MTNIIYDMSEDTRIREIARLREKAMHDEASALKHAKAEGIEEGIAQGMAQGMAQGITKGIAQGMAQGMTKGKNEIIAQMKAAGMTDEQISFVLGQKV